MATWDKIWSNHRGRTVVGAGAIVVGVTLAATLIASGLAIATGPASSAGATGVSVKNLTGMAIDTSASSSAVSPAASPAGSAATGTAVASTGVGAITTPTPTGAPTDATVGPTPTAHPSVAPTPTPPPRTSGWSTVLNNQFDSGGIPGGWFVYDGPYGSGPRNCAVPSHVTVSGGYLHLLMSYETSGRCGAGWYTGGLSLRGASSIDQRVTVRFRIVESGATAHFIIPMRWPDAGSSWPAGGEEDFCERSSTTSCTTYLHYGASNSQKYHTYSLDFSQWHTLRFQRSNSTVSAFVDNMGSPVWTFSGDSTTLPNTLKHVVLQQECLAAGCPGGTTGTQDIQIDWITVENPA